MKNFLRNKKGKMTLSMILVLILCASMELTSIPRATATSGQPDLYGPLLNQWEYLTGSLGIEPANIDVNADKLTINVPYDFFVEAPYYSGYYVRFQLNWGDGTASTLTAYDSFYSIVEGEDIFNVTATHQWNTVGTKSVVATATYIRSSDNVIATVWSYPTRTMTLNYNPVLSDDDGNGQPLDGPYLFTDGTYLPIAPDALIVDIQYFFHIHLYHLAHSESDFLHGVLYEYSWGDGSSPTRIPVPLDGVPLSPPEAEMASHSWSSTGDHLVQVRAGWYPKDYPSDVNYDINEITQWTDINQVTVHINEPSVSCQLTVLAYNQYGLSGYVPLYIDGQNVGTTGYTYTVTGPSHQIYVESPIYQGGYHLFQYYYYDGSYNYNNPMTLSVTSDKTVTAYYYSY